MATTQANFQATMSFNLVLTDFIISNTSAKCLKNCVIGVNCGQRFGAKASKYFTHGDSLHLLGGKAGCTGGSVMLNNLRTLFKHRMHTETRISSRLANHPHDPTIGILGRQLYSVHLPHRSRMNAKAFIFIREIENNFFL